MILNVAGVAFSYNSHPVLDGVSFSLAPGELLAVLGPNGVGKTTLLKCINAIRRPSRGSVMVDGADVLGLSPLEVARAVGYVAQQTEAARLTVFDAVLMGRRPHLTFRTSRRDLETVDAALRRLGLHAMALRYIDELSGGELQKVAIARALVQEPRLMLLDEPTASLDLKNQIEILAMIRRVVREHAVAAVMSLHDLNTALRFADKCVFLKDGRIHFAGESLQVDAETIEAVYGLPVEIHTHRGQPLVVPLATL
jgi:iron complex transport system ATP-binding protein